ncbi:unnamed protein product [Orchesella dallaii]|uniref:Uncharacterized protein n=1 Tax=Orchesella dallaii TaxID=48710 RepID=A0ABP1S1X8_9HEXA
MKDRIARLQSELLELVDYTQDYEATTIRHIRGFKREKGDNETEIGRANIVASNALLIHAMSHRYAAKIPRIESELMKEDYGEALKESIAVFYEPQLEADVLKPAQYRDHIPSDRDLQDALTSLSTLYEFSKNVTPYNFAARLSSDTNQPILVNAYHATKISLTSFYHGMFGNAFDWILYADERTLQYSDDSISRDVVLYLKLYMIKMHNAEMFSPTKALPVSLNFYTDSVNNSMVHNVKGDKKRSIFIERFRRNELDVPSEVGYWVLCQGENLQAEENKSKLKCYLEYGRYSIFTLLPLKVEELSISPKILQFYDVLGGNEIQSIISLANTKPSLKLTTVFEEEEQDVKRKPPGRTSTRIENLSELVHLAKKVELITGLESSLDGSLDFEALEYVPGTYDFVHNQTVSARENEDYCLPLFELCVLSTEYFLFPKVIDPSYSDDVSENDESTNGSGDELGSIAFYLTTVEEGGYTPFLNARTFAKPVKGSAIYWYVTFNSKPGR